MQKINVLSFRSASNLMSKMFSTDSALVRSMHKECTWNLPQCLQNGITPRDSINITRPRHVYPEPENWQTKKELLAKRTHYIYILLAFMTLNTIWLTEDFISGLIYNTNRKNKTRHKRRAVLRSLTDNEH
jgi:hypothetical protein